MAPLAPALFNRHMASVIQTSLFDLSPQSAPAGLRYEADVITLEEEERLMGHFNELEFAPFDFHGFQGNRRIVSFGSAYDFSSGVLREARALPSFLQPLRARAAEFAGLVPADFIHAMVTEYAPGAGIGWHRDRPAFHRIVGVSLGAQAVLRFRRKSGETWERIGVPLAPRSIYLLDGPARTDWQHSITPGETLRYSVTFRTLR